MARKTGLTRATISNIIPLLLKSNLVYEGDFVADSSLGRNPLLIHFNESCGAILVANLGMDVIEAGILDFRGNLLYESRFEGDNQDWLEFQENLSIVFKELFVEYLKVSPTPIPLKAVCFGLHGFLKEGKGGSEAGEENVFVPYSNWPAQEECHKILQQSLIKHWEQRLSKHPVTVRERLKKKLGVDINSLPILLESEANLNSIGEWLAESQQSDCSNLVGVSIGSTVRCGIIGNNALFRGAQNLAGRMGHITVESGGLDCPCGSKGCLDQYISNIALSRIQEEDPSARKLKEIVFSDDFLHYHVELVRNLSLSVNPELIVYNQDIFFQFPDLIDRIEDRLGRSYFSWPKLKVSEFREKALLYGGVSFAVSVLLDLPLLRIWPRD